MPVYCLLPLITAFLAMIWDAAAFRIPNRLLAFCFLTGAAERIFRVILLKNSPGAVSGFADMIAGIVLPAVILAVPFLLRGLGAGDIKLFCVLGSMMGGRRILDCMLYSFLAGGLEALFLLSVRREPKQRFHFAVPVFAGTCICCFMWGKKL